MASTSNEEGQILKKHVITTLVIETKEVNDYVLRDTKHQVIIKADQGRPKKTEVTHSRSIFDDSKFSTRSYDVQWNTPEVWQYMLWSFKLGIQN